MVDENSTWSLNSPETARTGEQGSQGEMVSLEPNWPPAGQTVRDIYEFKTEIIESRSGKEQRIALRQSPRRSFEYESLVSGDQFRQFKDLMWRQQHLPMKLLHPIGSSPSVPPPYGLVGLPGWLWFEDVPSWVDFNVECALVLDGSISTQTVVSMFSFSGLTGVLLDGFQEDHTVLGAQLRLFNEGYLSTTIQAGRLTNDVTSVGVRFDVDVGSMPVAQHPDPVEHIIFLKRPNWVNRVDVSHLHDADIVDYGQGRVSRSTPVPYGFETRSATYLNRTSTEVNEFVDLYHRLRGRQGEFLMPSWEYDFKPKVAAPVGSDSLRVAGTTFASTYADLTTHKVVFALMNNGDLLIHKVHSVEAVSDAEGDDSLILLDGSTWEEEVSEETVVMTGWVLLYRLATDILTVEWLTDRVAQVVLNMQSLEYNPLDTLAE